MNNVILLSLVLILTSCSLKQSADNLLAPKKGVKNGK